MATEAAGETVPEALERTGERTGRHHTRAFFPRKSRSQNRRCRPRSYPALYRQQVASE